MNKRLILAISATLLMQSCVGLAIESAKPTLRERIKNILSTNPFSEYYVPQSEAFIPKKPNIKEALQLTLATNQPVKPSEIDFSEEANGYLATATVSNIDEAKVVEAETAAHNASEADELIAESMKLRALMEAEFASAKNDDVWDIKAPESSSLPQPEQRTLQNNSPFVQEDESLDKELPNRRIRPSDATEHEYIPGSTYNVSSLLGYITDISLEFGENLERITVGDNERWNVETYQDKVQGVWHIYLQPIQNDISTNMIISTDKRNYQLMLNAFGEHEAMVHWTYQKAAQEYVIPKERNRNIIIPAADKLDFSYKMDNYKFNNAPQYIFNDGQNTYISFSPDVIDSINPAILAKVRYTNNYTIVDYEKSGTNIVIPKVLTDMRIVIRNKTINIKKVF